MSTEIIEGGFRIFDNTAAEVERLLSCALCVVCCLEFGVWSE